jgi:hypothetical protein
MKRLKRSILVLSLGGAMALATSGLGGPAVAVPPHRHCLLTSSGYVEIGRGVVNEAPHDTAFHNLHSHVHVGAPPTDIVPLFDLSLSCSSLNQ